jgi:hypothetical protein
MLTFREWLLAEEKHVPPSVLQAYERALQEELRRLIQRTKDPALRQQFEQMIECPIMDSRGNCHRFADYVLSALIRQGLHTRYDVQAALGYVFEKMLMPHTEAGEPRATVFGGFQERPDFIAGENPLQARFLAFLGNAIRTIKQGKVPRLANVERRPQGTVSIGLGRRQEGDPAGGVSPDEIAAPSSGEGDLAEMIQDITTLLARRQRTLDLPLVPIFQAMMAGVGSHDQRQQFGDRPTRAARPVIVQTIRDYARSSGNQALLNLLRRFEDFDATRPTPTTRRAAKPARPVLSDRERDYASIAQVVARFDRPVGTADLGRYRRRWLEYPPREPSSGHRNRLEETLAAMVRDDVLKAVQTRSGATVYERGPRFEEVHQQEVGVE